MPEDGGNRTLLLIDENYRSIDWIDDCSRVGLPELTFRSLFEVLPFRKN